MWKFPRVRFGRLAALFAIGLFWIGMSSSQAGDYEATVATWKSYEDVGNWLKRNFDYDMNRFDTVMTRIRQDGPAGLLTRAAPTTFDRKRGICGDAAAFAVDALNRVNPDYKARYIFIRNHYGQPHHWVTGFYVDGKIMVMDYGAGQEWWKMKGIHGPYDSLDQFADFLASLKVRWFAPESVEWRDRMPGQQD